MTVYALRLANGVDTAPRVRMADSLGLQHGGGPLVTRGGLRADGGGAVSAVSGTMTVQVTPFLAWVPGGESDLQGGYPFVLDATATLTIADGDASLSRTDVVCAVVREDAFDGSGETEATLEVVQGVPGAGVPALPSSAQPLRNITIPAGLSAGTGGLSSSNIDTDRRQWLSGGVLTVAGAGERDGLGAQPGQVVYRVDTDQLQVWNGAEWNSYFPGDGRFMQAGTAEVPVVNGYGSLEVQFPVQFGAPPVVVATPEHSFFAGGVAAPTASAVEIRGRHLTSTTSTTTLVVHWHAYGLRA